MSDKTYDDGLREGRVTALEAYVSAHGKRLDHHSRRLRFLEVSISIGVGGLLLLQLFPVLTDIFSVGQAAGSM